MSLVLSARKTVVFGLLTLVLLALPLGVLFAVTLPQRDPDGMLALEVRITQFLDGITLPIKLAKLSMREPDRVILMPVHGERVSSVADTWQAARGADRLHEGQDIFAPKGTPVFAGIWGYVRRAGTNELGGNYVMVTGAGGRRYYYAHFDRIAEGIHVGQKVGPDTVLGFVGNTGNAITTPPHLHFGMYEGREAINPLSLMKDR